MLVIRGCIYSIVLVMAFWVHCANAAFPDDSLHIKKVTEAQVYLNKISKLEKSALWPNVDPDVLLENLKTFTTKPLSFHEGRPTNFCAYSAVTYIPLTYDPLGFSKFIVDLYRYGQASMGRVIIKPSKAVREAAGKLKYKGDLDINHAGQMWFLVLADHFKGYLNFFNRNFQIGDENTFWAATNYAKFNKMVRRLFPGKITARGADLIRPSIDPYTYVREKLPGNVVFLYLNNKKLYKKTHTRQIIKTPTHYVLVTRIEQLPDGKIEFAYWDYGKITLRQLSPDFFKRIVYGVTVYYPNKKRR